MPRERSWGIPQEVNRIMQLLFTCHRVFSECVGPRELRFEVLQLRAVGTSIHTNSPRFRPMARSEGRWTGQSLYSGSKSSDQTHRMGPAWPQALGWAVAQEKCGQRGFAFPYSGPPSWMVSTYFKGTTRALPPMLTINPTWFPFGFP